MKTIELRGDDYIRFSKLVYMNHLSGLKNWEQPLNFKENSYFLQQQAGGPCGLFAVFNSHIILKRNDPKNLTKSPDDLLYSVILDIFKRVSSYSNSKSPEYKPIYVFCDCLIPENNYIHFQYTESSDEAYDFLVRTKYTMAYNSCLMITLSIVFASLGMQEFRNPSEYEYICEGKGSSIALVFLMLDGSTSSLHINDSHDSGLDGIDQKDIGIKVINNYDEEANNVSLNSQAKIFILLDSSHFSTVQIEGDKLVVYDSMNPNPPYKVNKKMLGF